MRNQEGNIELRKKANRRKTIFYFKLDMNMFFCEISRSFSCFLVVLLYDIIIFDFVIFSSMKSAQIVYIQSKYIQNQVVYHSILKCQFINNLEHFWANKILVSTFYTVYCRWSPAI